ncbi:FCD domain-containing protein [Sporomusa termitida]|uniref:FCD domain protein n=1 Tax=Sporomusa termitida TaxID=2377 RepID=A0A517DNQ1_9FIRM|nr:FCD domain-containing protein [Sporomusa termitida]QDR78972.1 FCD domain protein [Sporomusa termitida]
MALSDKENLEYDILSIINESNGRPMGCGSIAVKLQSLGYSFSEATVGRILRDMDIAGWTEKAGFQGRRLSGSGSERLEDLAGKERRQKQGEELLAAVQGHTREQLLEVLIARRAIEGELAYLAAQNAKPEEIQALQAALAAEDVVFHGIIVNMARNRVLAAAISLIRQDTQLSPVLEHIRLQVHSLVHVDHQKIAESIRSGNGDKARAAMIEHINNLISDVEKYWQPQIGQRSDRGR